MHHFLRGNRAHLAGFNGDHIQRLSVQREEFDDVQTGKRKPASFIPVSDQIRQWRGDDHREIDVLQVGGIIKFGGPADLMTGTIDVLNPPHEFAIKWPPQAQYHSIPMVTRYRLMEENGGTRLTVRKTGFEAMPDDIRQERIDSTKRGYEQVLAQLKAYVEGGTPSS